MFFKLLLRILPFTLLIYSIQSNTYANNTSNTSENTEKNEREKNKNKEENNTDVDDNDNIEEEYNIEENNDNNDKDNNNIDEYNFDEDDNNIDKDEESIDEDEDSFDGDEDSFDEDEDSFDGDEDSFDENEDSFDEDEDSEDEVYDPLEKINRKIFKFNDTMDNVLSKIMTKNKNRDKSKRSPILTAIGNLSHNFFEAPIGINYALQGNVKNTSNSIARLIINTAFGFFGVTDVAEKLGFKKNNTYFGDTLKKWGMKPGPYVVLPILGPTSLRGAVGQAFGVPIFHTTAKLPIRKLKPVAKNTIYYAAYCSKLLATRAAYAEMIEQVSAMSKDKYKTFRNITMASERN